MHKQLLIAALVLPVGGFAFVVCFGPCYINSRQDRARMDLRNVKGGLALYHRRHGRLPTTEEGIGALVKDTILDELPYDPWHAVYLYRREGDEAVIWTLGGDGAPGGEGQDADLSERYTPLSLAPTGRGSG